MNYNKLNFIGTIFGLVIGIGFMIGLPLILTGRAPQHFILILIFGTMAFSIILMFVKMILLLLKKNMMTKLIAPVFIPVIAMIVFSALITYQILGPQLVDPEKLPYFELIASLKFQNILGYLPYLTMGTVFLFLTPFLIYFFKFLYETIFTREKLLKNGLSGQAKIISIHDFGISLNKEPVYTITLEINSPSHGIYLVTKDFLVPHFTLGDLAVGKIVNIKIDPQNPQNVALDTWTGDMS